MSKLEGRVAIVTGAGSGIGASIARMFAAEGAFVAAVDIDESAATRTVEGLEGGQGRAYLADVSNPDEVAEVVDRVLGEVGSVDVLVNNAGLTRIIPFADLLERDWDEILGVNAKGAVFFIKAVSHAMKRAGAGAIINISSIAGKGWPRTSNVAYAASKGALLTATRTLAAELAPYGVRVNAVCPGLTDTPLLDSLTAQAARSENISLEEAKTRLTDLIPLGRTNAPDDIARACLFLASEDSRNVTGQSLNVDGGLVWD